MKYALITVTPPSLVPQLQSLAGCLESGSEPVSLESGSEIEMKSTGMGMTGNLRGAEGLT